MFTVDTESFLVIVTVAALAAFLAALVGSRLVVPVVVIEIVAGIVVGPEVLDIAESDEFIDFFSNLGLGMLFFFAGYEIDFERIRGAPLRLAVLGWFMSLALAYALGGVGRGWPLIERTLETSGQLAIRIAVVLVFALGALASTLGLDLLLGGFVAGVIVRLALKGHEVRVFESKLTAVGYGFFIPFFFVTSGLEFDLSALTDDPIRLLELPLFLALFLIVRGVPALVLYRRELDHTDRLALAVFSSTQLPLVVAITTIAIEEGHMRAATAASLVGAAILSTMIFPLLGLRLRGN